MVDDAGDAGVDVGAAELFGRYRLAGRRLDQRGAAEEDRPLIVDDHRFIAHGGNVGPAGGAGAEDGGKLRYSPGRHARLVVKDAAKVIAVGEDIGLLRQEGSSRVDEVDAGQEVALGDFLGAKVLFHRHGSVSAPLDGGVVGADHAEDAGDFADACQDAGGRRCGIQAVPCQGRELEKGRALVEQTVDTRPYGQLVALAQLLLGFFASAKGDLLKQGLEFFGESAMKIRIGEKIL